MEKESSSDDKQLLDFCQTSLKTLCGDLRVPKECPITVPDSGDAILDRSVIFTENHRTLAVDYLEYLARGFGYTDVVRQKFTKTVNTRFGKMKSSEVPYENLVITIRGSEFPLETIILGAHYDVQNSFSKCWTGRESGPDSYVATDGADDNGSGVIGCMALLRKFAYQSFPRTLKVVLFDGEEPGIINSLCSGSNYFKKSIEDGDTSNPNDDPWECTSCSFYNHDPTETTCSSCGEIQLPSKIDKQNVKLVFCIDMIGGPPTFEPHGFFISSFFPQKDQYDSWNEKIQSWKTKNSQLPGDSNVTLGKQSEHENCIYLSDTRFFAQDEYPCMLLGNCSLSHLPRFYHNTRDDCSIISWDTFLFAIHLAEFIIVSQLSTPLS